MKRKINGFTLIELSIVIVIIGLIVAGVVGGQALVRQAKARSLITDFNKYELALNNFRLEYNNAIPGDFAKAQDYWGVGVTNGDGDGVIEFWPPATNFEDTHIWNHLSQAELIAGTYSGGISGSRFEYGINVPTGPFSNSAFAINTNVNPTYGKIRTILTIASIAPNNPMQGFQNRSVIDVRIAKGIDDKADDGEASTGKYLTFRGNEVVGTNVCVTDIWTAPSADWLLTDTTISCRIAYDVTR